ncbi:GtrA family protein [Porphyromonas crevioricanis JCM 15906]|uniref:GtrA family protein n=1 Tax=Porphyromonas crevioricanis JCM 15906 TaxID=1305617 RepID=S4NB52_9PORP|nr:GtrA family protein [Porphyromonas crevioricanis JCM 15906]GAD07061.1 GtrA family protein [Porphyromonas crevioricanis JCM 13913]
MIQLIKYGLIGVSNTLITAIVIWVLLKKADSPDWIANLLGYTAGIINSFVWNRKWTFSSEHSWTRDFLIFLLAFLICYLIQYAAVFVLNRHTTYDSYYNHVIGMLLYTILNFLFNKYITFSPVSKQCEA